MNNYNDKEEIIEISNDDTTNTTDYELKVEEPIKRKITLKERWNNLEKKTQIIIIASLVSILVLALLITIYFVFFFNKEEVSNNKESNNNESVTLDKDNYRYENGNLVFLDKSNRTLGSYTCSNKNPDTCLVAKNDLSEDTFNRTKSIYENGEELKLGSIIYFDRYVFVQDGEDIYLYDITNNTNALTLKKIKVYDMSTNLVVVKDDKDRYGLLEITEDGYNYVVKNSYDYLAIIDLEDNYLLAKNGDNQYILDVDGKMLTANLDGEVMSANDKYYTIKKNNQYNLYTLKSDEVASAYDYIEFNGEVISLIKDNYIYLIDNDLNKLNEDGIKVTSKDYEHNYIYTKDNKFKELKEAYSISLMDNIATIKVGKNTYDINIMEGLVNKDNNYINYFDGILYIYSDLEKTDLIGSYTCTFKNEIKDENSLLDKCMLYSNENGMSGIYNSNYVFIKDNNSIFLYDINAHKTIGTYSEIKMLNDSEINKNIKMIYTDSSYIMAKSSIGVNTGNYGILEIGKDKAQGKVGFNYASITKNGNFYLMINKDEKYQVYDHMFNVVSDIFNYIELYDKYYIGIVDGKLNIYHYDNKTPILKESLAIEGTSFSVDFTNGFDITIDGILYKHDLEGNYYEE